MTNSEQFLNNAVLWVAVSSWAIAQIIKIVIDLIKTRKLSLDILVSTGGFPSSHTAFVIALAGGVGFVDGFHSTTFAISFVLSCVVMYDAMGIRRAAGDHAKILNQLVLKLDNNYSVEHKLKELLGHTPLQVLGGFILGIIVSTAAFA